MIFNSKKGKRMPKIALFSALLLAMVMMLASCGGTNTATPSLSITLTDEMYDEAGGNLEKGEIEEIAKFLASNTGALEQLIAADRGYDMTAEGFDDDNLPEAKPEKSVEFAVNVLSKADTEGKLNGVSYRSINAEDIKSIIGATVVSEPVVEKGIGGVSKANLNKIAKYLYENKPADDAAWVLDTLKDSLAGVEELKDADADKLNEEAVAALKAAVEAPVPKVSEISYDAKVNSLSQAYLIKIAEKVNLADNAETLAALKASVNGEEVDMEAALAALDNNTFDVEYTGLNAGDVKLIIKSLQQTVNTTANRNILANVMYWIGLALGAITNTIGFGNYLVGICVFAIVVELALIPFSVKQQKTQIKQAKLKPKEMAIRKKYAGRNDRVTQQKLNEEIQQLYQEENVSPLSGCLPLLIQLPIVMVLYYIVIDPMQYVFGFSTEVSSAFTTFMSASRAAGGLGVSISSGGRGSIEALSLIHEAGLNAFAGLKDFALYANGDAVFGLLEGVSIPSFNIGPINTGLIPSITRFDWLLLIPVLTFAVQFTTMKLTKKFTAAPAQTAAGDDKAMACQNNMMDFMMPAMSVYIAFIVPGAVGIYWIFKGVLGFVKTVIMSKVMPLPKFTEADYKAAEQEMKGKAPKKVEKSENAGKVRSLHHIDDEDYDDQGNYVGDPNGNAAEKAVEEEKPTELPENNMTAGATLKDDSDRGSKKKKKKKTESDKGDTEN